MLETAAAPSHRQPSALHAPLRLGTAVLPPRLRPDALGVLDVTEWFGDTSGGIRTYLLQKARYVAAREELRQVILVPGQRDAISDEPGVRMYRLRGPRIPRQPPYRFMLATRSVARIARHEAPDLIEIGSPFLVPWLVERATRRLDVPLVSFYHSNLPRLFSSRGRDAGAARASMYRATWRYMRRLDRLFATTIVTSRFSADDLAHEGIERVVRVPLGVDLQRFHPDRRAHAADTRARFGLPDGPLAGFIGRFAREKELDVLLGAWPEVQRRTGARLVMVGGGPLEATLRAHANAGEVTFLPFVRDRDTVADLLAALDICIAPGSIETFGLSSLEALASGTPVLSAHRGGVAEQVMQSGGGLLFEAGNSAALADAAIALLRDDLAMRGARGRQYAEFEHSWETVFDRLFDVYRTVIAEHAGR